MTKKLTVYRVEGQESRIVGAIDCASGCFAYNPLYLSDSAAAPISQSLPLRSLPFGPDETRAYFDGLLPEGAARTSIAAALRIREDDYLSMLGNNGFDCIGDIVVSPAETPLGISYEALSPEDMRKLLASAPSTARAVVQSRLSLGGTQNKLGLAHIPSADLTTGWLRPLGGAASTHILKTSEREGVLYLEYLCTGAARLCGVSAARTHLLDLGRPVICSERFDRSVAALNGKLVVQRLHQEDCTQAFGLSSGSKYAELEPSTAAAVAQLLRTKANSPIASLDAFVRLTCYNYLIGNCDNHLKNMSLLYRPSWRGFDLGPGYDLVCTTWFPDFSREMGMGLGTTRDIDAVTARDIVAFAQDARYPLTKLRRICHELAALVHDAVHKALNEAPCSFDELAWKAEGLLEDIEPRRRILETV